jgi:hypothetical protein
MLNITHTSGFFSCCSSKLTDIVSYFNKNKKLPKIIDTKEQFSLYKQNNRKDDITFDYFKYNDDEIKYSSYVDYHWMYQFCDYKKINYNMILPFVKKYFGITEEIQNIINTIEIKYNLDYSNICVLFHRGNDKCTETKICNYNDTIYQANKIKANNPNIIFLIQSDETEFIITMLNLFPNSIYFKDEIRHINKMKTSVDIVYKNTNYEYSKKYLAITVIMSKCKYIICGSGNCSIWIMFYRGHASNVVQYLEGVWL